MTEQVIEAILAEVGPEDHEVKPADVAVEFAHVCERAGRPGEAVQRAVAVVNAGEGRPS